MADNNAAPLPAVVTAMSVLLLLLLVAPVVVGVGVDVDAVASLPFTAAEANAIKERSSASYRDE